MCRLDDNIKIDLKEQVRVCGLDQCSSEYVQLAGCCTKGNELSFSTKCGQLLH